jgi:hypothetical protein
MELNRKGGKAKKEKIVKNKKLDFPLSLFAEDEKVRNERERDRERERQIFDNCVLRANKFVVCIRRTRQIIIL